MRKRPTIHIILFCLFILLVGITGFIFYHSTQKDRKLEAYRSLSTLASLKIQQIENWINTKHYDAEYIFNNYYLCNLLYTYQIDPETRSNREILEFLDPFIIRSDYSDVLFLTKTGKVLSLIKVDKKKSVITSYIPILEKRSRKLLGILVLRTDPEKDFFPLVSTTPLGLKSAESFIVKQDGDSILFINHLKYRDNKHSDFKLPLSTKELPSAMAIKGYSGIFEGRDYIGTRVLADLRHIPKTNWFLISKVSKDEIYWPGRKSAGIIGTAIIVIVILFGMLLRMQWKNEKIKIINQQLQVEKEKNKVEVQLIEAQALAHLGSWELDLQKNILTWSDETYRIFGLQPQEFGANYEAFLERVYPDEREAVNSMYINSIKEGKNNYEIEHRIIRRDGDIRYVHEKCEHQRDAHGKIIRSVGMVQDITERKKAELRLERTLNDLKRSNKELEQFAYTASHDLQEPIRMVKSYAQLFELRNQNLNTDSKEYLNFITEGATRMQDLVDGLLAYSRLTTRDSEYQDVDCNQIVKKVLKDLEIRIEETCAEVKVDSLPIVKGNPVQIRQLFQNLIQNALKFLDTRKPKIKISCTKKDLQWMFSVEDNGIGIEPQYYDKIFEMFQRLHTREKYPGTGIGLSLCKKIVERHGGHIYVESIPGRGSIFSFTMPEN